MEKLTDAGIRAGVLLSPVIPGITDDPANLERVVKSAADHGAQFLGTRILYLQPGTREHFLGFLKSEYPALLAEYRRLFPGSYAPKHFQEEIRQSVHRFKEVHELQDRPVQPPRVLQQLSLEACGEC
jgi:DNA repair photolyase